MTLTLTCMPAFLVCAQASAKTGIRLIPRKVTPDLNEAVLLSVKVPLCAQSGIRQDQALGNGPP